VEIGDAIEMKEIPFVVGVLADLSGKPDEPLPKMKDRIRRNESQAGLSSG
jgi:type VI secretion system protein ImpB